MALQAPEGTKDLLPDEAKFWAHFKATAADMFGRYGYVTIETPVFEQTELFVRGIGEATDVVSKEMFTAISGENLNKLLGGGTIKGKSRLSLRPEGTAGVVRAVVQHDLVPQGAAPAKLMYAGPMFRAERPQKGRQRQFNQVGIECLGAEDPSVDAEGIIMLMRFFAAIGIPVDATRLLVNSMGCEQCRPAYRDAVKAYMDAHADELCDECKRRAEINPLRAFDCKNPDCAAVMADAPKITEHLCASSLDASKMLFIDDEAELPVCERLGCAADAADLMRIARSIGLEMSERTAHRILSGQIKPLRSVTSRLLRMRSERKAPAPIDLSRDRRGLKIAQDDLDEFSRVLERDFEGIAARYYLSLSREPRIRVSRDSITVTFDIQKGE